MRENVVFFESPETFKGIVKRVERLEDQQINAGVEGVKVIGQYFCRNEADIEVIANDLLNAGKYLKDYRATSPEEVIEVRIKGETHGLIHKMYMVKSDRGIVTRVGITVSDAFVIKELQDG